MLMKIDFVLFHHSVLKQLNKYHIILSRKQEAHLVAQSFILIYEKCLNLSPLYLAYRPIAVL